MRLGQGAPRAGSKFSCTYDFAEAGPRHHVEASSRNGSSGGQFLTESHASARMRSFSTARR